ncbi:MAG: 50S ribosomal protein L11 methyltransferase [Solirubrobacterales bacterium]
MIRLALRVRREDAEVALAELLELAPSGVEELEVGEWVEYAVYGAPGELPELPDLRAAVGGALVEVSTSELPDDWGERWKGFHRPVLVEPPSLPFGESVLSAGGGLSGTSSVPSLHVRPPWEPPSGIAGAREIVIDPGQAFGTGAHDTTRMCLELLLELASLESERGPVMDVGCGSGVLAIAAAQLGFAPVLGLDHESESVQAARENAAVNGVSVDVRRFDLRREPLPAIGGGPASVMLANLVRPLLLDLAGSLERPPEHLIASGLLREEAEEVAGVFGERLGLRLRARREGGEWAAVWLTSRQG